MADDTNTAERESFEAHYRRCGANDATLSRWVDDGSTPPAMVGKYIIRSVQDAWLAFQAGRASLAASAGSEPVAAGSIDHLKLMMEESAWGGQILLSDALANIDEFAGLHPSPLEGMAGWISVDERLPEVGVTVLVYEPFRHGEDWPGTVRISFDHICPDYEGWHDHCASYEHFMAVGGVNACGSDVTCTGPSEKAPYTHWMPLPAPPLPASEAKEL